MKRKQFVVLTHDPHRSAHFWKVASEMFRGTYAECEQYLDEHHGYIWAAEHWDKGH
jgi:prephenate dehydrogenase